MRRTSLHLSDVQRDRLRAASHATGLGAAELVRRALDLFLPHCEPPEPYERAGAVPSPGPTAENRP